MNSLILNGLAISALAVFIVGCNTTSSIQSVRKEEADFSKILTYSYVDSGMARTLPGVSPAELLWAEGEGYSGGEFIQTR